WDEDDLAINNYRGLGERLPAAGDLYRRPGYASGLLLASPQAHIQPVVINTGNPLAAVTVDRVRVRVVQGGHSKGSLIPAAHRNTMLQSEVFLQRFQPLDAVIYCPLYLPNFELTKRGFNDGGVGQRLLYIGPEPEIATDTTALGDFLAAMAFATSADRT